MSNDEAREAADRADQSPPAMEAPDNEHTDVATAEVPEPLAVPQTLAYASPQVRSGKGRARLYFDLLLISFLILFWELACIRWFSSMVIFLTFFTNIVLMACFLGMSVGCFAASRKRELVQMVLPLALVSALLAAGTYFAYSHFNRVVIDVGNQASPQLIYFGTEYREKAMDRFVVPLWAVAGVFFALISLIFVGLGQVMGRTFDAIPNRVGAYMVNVLGSLLGIAAFFAASWFRTSPHLWFGVCVAITLYFVTRWSAVQIFSQLALMALIAATAYGVGEDGQLRWSPYYKIRYTAQTGDIFTNNISHQQMLKIADSGPAYALPHLLNRDAGNPPFKDVLIIGAGSGNDVAAALAYGAEHIDAVEIDPVINSIGKADHPDKPFDDKARVKVYYDDGRRFLKKNPQKKYDLIVYALVDSLVLHSGYSSLRLESFLFTQEAFNDIRSRLKDDGVFIMYNYFRQGWVVGRLHKMAEASFNSQPVVMSMPRQQDAQGNYTDRIAAEDNQANHITFFLVGNGTQPTVENVRRKMQESSLFWVNGTPKRNQTINGYTTTRPSGDAGWRDFALTKVETAGISTSDLPRDNWPFLYLRDKKIPFEPSGQGIIAVAAISLIILLAFVLAPSAGAVRRIRPNGQMFFLGAGFMLLETKGVVHMALLFGSTWVVNSVVFAAILVMILLANLYVLIVRPHKLWPYYALLVVALAINVLVPMSFFLSRGPMAQYVLSCAVVFVPIFFAGVIFATAFRDSKQPDADLGSNIAGVILGGLSEYLSLILGFNYLLLVAIAFYLLSAVLRPRPQLREATPATA